MAIKKQQAVKAKKPAVATWPLYIIFAAVLVAYVLMQGSALSVLFGAIALFLLIVIIVMEFMVSGREEGYKRSIAEVAVALAVIVVLWFALQFFLNTGDPIDVVPSCSMLPALQRGDLIVLSGTAAGALRAPKVNVSRQQMDGMLSNYGNESLVCLSYAYTRGGNMALSQFQQQGYSLGLFRFTGSAYEPVSQGAQDGNLVQYACGYQPVRLSNGTVADEAYTSSITVNGIQIGESLNNSIVVYSTVPSDYFHSLGDTYIVHRAYAVLNASGSYYVLTKGDNNPALDVQFMNLPPSSSEIQGSMVLDVPYLGYFKILLSSDLAQPTGCNSTVLHS